jgi:hypothetical protein
MLVLNDELEKHLQSLEDDDDDDGDGDILEQTGKESQNCETQRRDLPRIGGMPFLLSHGTVGVFGYLIGKGNVKWMWTRVLFLFVAHYALRLVWKLYTQRRDKMKREQLVELRLELIKLLGTIGAPALQHRTYEFVPVEKATRIVQFVQAQVELFAKMEVAMEILSTTTAMQLGVGPYSPSVERLSIANMRPILAKRILAETIFCHKRVLYNLLNEDDADAIEAPSVVTLRWLKASQSEFCCLVSEVTNVLLTIEMSEEIQLDIRATIDKSREASKYLEGIFGCTQQPRTSQVSTCPQRLQQQMGAAQAALWAFDQQSTDDTRREWLDRFLRILVHAKELGENLRSETESTIEMEDVTCEVKDENILGTELVEQSGKFEDCGKPHQSSNTTQMGMTEKRVVVFSGKGKNIKSTQKNPRDDRAGQQAVTQYVILSELKTRLAAMDKADEVEANEVSDDEDETADGCSSELTTTIWPSVSNDACSLFSELNLALMNKKDGEAENIFG